MAVVVRMPSVLAGATEAALARWLVSPGDSVSVGTPIAELETEKALVEYAAEEAGTVGRLLLGEGDTAEIGAPIAVLLAAGETGADIDAALGANGLTRPGPQCGAAVTQVRPRSRQPAVAGGPPPAPAAARRTGTTLRGGAGGYSLARWCGSWPGSAGSTWRGWRGRGRTGGSCGGTWSDSLRRPRRPPGLHLAQPSRAPARWRGRGGGARSVLDDAGAAQARDGSAAGPAGATLIPHTPMRRAIARRLTESKGGIPHFYLVAECVVDELLALRGRVNERCCRGIGAGQGVGQRLRTGGGGGGVRRRA